MTRAWPEWVGIPNGTRIFNHGADQCVALINHYHENWIGGAFIPAAAARDWAERNWAELDRLYTKSLYPQAGAIFIALGGIYDRTYGHIGGVVSEAYTDGSFDSMEQNAGSGAARWTWRFRRKNDNSIFHFLIPKNNPAKNNKPLEPHQRRAHGEPVKRREQPSSKSKDLGDWIQPGEVGNFDAWIYGESVGGINVWFRGISGAWFWAGGFTSQTTAGLTDLNPKTPPAVQPNQRKVAPVEVNTRKSPTAAAERGKPVDANSVITPEGWVRGQRIEGIDVWFKIAGWYSWAGGFTNQATGGLKDLNALEPERPVEPPEVTDPTGPDPKTTGSPGIVLATIDDWDKEAEPWGTVWERPQPASVFLQFPDFITERTVRPDSGFYTGRPGKPNHFGVHHADGVNLDGVVNHLMGQNGSTTSLVVKDHEAVYMVDSRDTPSTNGRFRSNQFSFTVEMCNDKVKGDRPSEASHETVAWAFAREALSWGMLTPLAEDVTVLGHRVLAKKAFPTVCPGLVDIPWIVRRTNEIIVANQHQTEPPAPDFSDLTAAMNGLSVVLRQVLALLRRIFNIGEDK